MRLIDYFPESSISIKSAAKDWQEAIDFPCRLCCKIIILTLIILKQLKPRRLLMALITFSLRVWQCLMPVRSAVP